MNTIDKKEIILNSINMENILDQYSFKMSHGMFACPFHGKDKHPSAKYYEKTFYCFCCGKTGDLIQFVQYYFNLSFKEAMEKINQDFNLGLQKFTTLDKEKINLIEEQKRRKEKIYNNKIFLLNSLCKQNDRIRQEMDFLQKAINIYNYEEITETIGKLQNVLLINDEKIEEVSNNL